MKINHLLYIVRFVDMILSFCKRFRLILVNLLVRMRIGFRQ
nr:MAG TPA: hypothetical protein [Caudoviricetes sp.]